MINVVAMNGVESNGHLAVAVEGCSGVLLVNQTHDLEIQRRFTRWLPVVGGAIETNEFTLPPKTEGRVVGLNHRPLRLN